MIDQSELPKDIKHKKRYHVHTCIQAFGHNLKSGIQNVLRVYSNKQFIKQHVKD